MRSTKPISSTLARSGFSTKLPFVKTLAMSSRSHRTSESENSLVSQSTVEPSVVIADEPRAVGELDDRAHLVESRDLRDPLDPGEAG